MRSATTTLAGWGRFRPVPSSSVLQPATTTELAWASLPPNDVIARGHGRSYGDAAVRTGGHALLTTNCTTVDWVDRRHGLIRADAGASIGQLIDRFAPKGWFVPVTPGTRAVTVGGAIAADIHGKNHHVDGSFGDHVRSLRLRLADDRIVELASDGDDADLFWATVGGMGLTGIIVDAVIALTRIPSTTIDVRTQRLRTLEQLLDEMRCSDAEHEFSVAWVDLLGGGRSVLTQGSFAEIAPAHMGAAGSHRQPPTSALGLPPVRLPRLAVTPGVRAFNELWWRKAPAEPTVTPQSITTFFHPLDAIDHWNRVYGPTGFVQWQCVIPEDADATLHLVADRLSKLPAYFTVLKRFGPANQAPLSFPLQGWTAAIDLPATDQVLNALPTLDQMVADCGGRIYLAKDARLSADMFSAMYPQLQQFRAIRDRVDPHRRFGSDLSARLGL